MDLLDVFWPKKCINCGRWGSYVCDECQVGLWEEEQIAPPPGFAGLTCLWAYAGVAQKIITKAKYKYFYDTLRYLVFNFQFSNNPQFYNFQKFINTRPVVVPVPLHPKRGRERGFNQAEVIAEQLSKRFEIEIEKKFLTRIKDTGHQTLRTRQERLEAVKGAFSLTPQPYTLNPNVLLVDDVWTTGATMSECCRVLKNAGVRRVWGLVLAR